MKKLIYVGVILCLIYLRFVYIDKPIDNFLSKNSSNNVINTKEIQKVLKKNNIGLSGENMDFLAEAITKEVAKNNFDEDDVAKKVTNKFGQKQINSMVSMIDYTSDQKLEELFLSLTKLREDLYNISPILCEKQAMGYVDYSPQELTMLKKVNADNIEFTKKTLEITQAPKLKRYNYHKEEIQISKQLEDIAMKEYLKNTDVTMCQVEIAMNKNIINQEENDKYDLIRYSLKDKYKSSVVK